MHPPAYPARPPARSQAAEDCPSVVPAALVLQSEVSQKEKDKYHILMNICEIRKKKNGIEDLIYKAETEIQA